ncbi:glycosyltransferase family 2 protein [Pseudomonadota bacterium]
MKIAVIVPVYNGGELLNTCLKSIARSSRRPDQVIVVDDSSTDGSESVANEHGIDCIVLQNGPYGPARARNRGAAEAEDADILVFVDADVAIQESTIERIEQHFMQNPYIDALFGSYDRHPQAGNIASLYKNLEHHHVHQTSGREASTFWAGCGAVRNAVFRSVGGFDETYGQPSIEDIELGSRMKNQGYRIVLCPDLQVKHLKYLTLGELIRTDIFCRAIPWSRLLIRQGRLPNELNLSTKRRLAAVAAVALAISSLMLWWDPAKAGVVALIAGAAFVGLNAGLLNIFRRRGGFKLCLAAGTLHLFYNLYSVAAFAWAICEEPARSWKSKRFQRKVLRRV